jgi:hypothetical protein
MPGEMTLKLLEPQTFDAFERLAHHYHHHLDAGAAVVAYSEAASRAIGKLPDDIVPASTEFDLLKQEIRKVAMQGQEIGAVMYECFRHVYQQERWLPYDGEAWDKFFAELTEQLKPRLVTFRQSIDSLKIPDALVNYMTEDDDLKHRISIIANLKAYLYGTIQELEKRLDPAYFESWCGYLLSSGYQIYT